VVVYGPVRVDSAFKVTYPKVQANYNTNYNYKAKNILPVKYLKPWHSKNI